MPFSRAVTRIPLALALGSITFTAGFYRLVMLTFQFMVRLLRGDAPDQAIAKLQHDRVLKSLKSK